MMTKPLAGPDAHSSNKGLRESCVLRVIKPLKWQLNQVPFGFLYNLEINRCSLKGLATYSHSLIWKIHLND